MQEILPVIAFIAAYLAAKWSGHSEQAIYWATAVLMISTVLQILVLRLRQKPISKQHWLTASAILVLGGVTLAPEKPDVHQMETEHRLPRLRCSTVHHPMDGQGQPSSRKCLAAH